MSQKSYCTMLEVPGALLHTTICLPEAEGSFPIVLFRSPYVDYMENMSDDEIAENTLREDKNFLDHGYATVHQHCRGRGRSTGDCIPFATERADGLALQAWVRQQSFYAGELYLCGGSYTTSVHYITAPWASDIKGAVLEIQDTEKYNCNYRNGFYKIGLAGNWYVGMYKAKSIRQKSGSPEAFKKLPLTGFGQTVVGEPMEDLEEIFLHPDRNDPFWHTAAGVCEDSGAVRDCRIPVLLTTAFYDIYTGGIFDMWNAMTEETRKLCALAVNPYNHGGGPRDEPISFENGTFSEQFGDYRVRWLDSIRGLCDPPFTPGKVTYYELFGNRWCCDDFVPSGKTLTFPLGETDKTYRYLPWAPATFPGGLSANFGSNEWQAPPNSRYDIISYQTIPFQTECLVKGVMRVRLRVRSSCPDTCFYVRLSLVKEAGAYGLRDDIHALSEFAPDYVPGEEAEMTFTFDPHAFRIQPGERIRIDVSSSCFPHYIPHTNRKGLFSLQTGADPAENTILSSQSRLYLCVE